MRRVLLPAPTGAALVSLLVVRYFYLGEQQDSGGKLIEWRRVVDLGCCSHLPYFDSITITPSVPPWAMLPARQGRQSLS